MELISSGLDTRVPVAHLLKGDLTSTLNNVLKLSATFLMPSVCTARSNCTLEKEAFGVNVEVTLCKNKGNFVISPCNSKVKTAFNF